MNSENPYQAPKSPSTIQQSLSAVTVILISLASVVAGVCMFFCTCLGGLALGGPGSIEFLLLWTVVAIIAAVFVAGRLGRMLTKQCQKRLDKKQQSNSPPQRDPSITKQ